MKGFKGCINPECSAYKKRTKYKKADEYCLKCGNPLSFVCSDCWKPLEDGKERYCISCTAEKEQKHAEKMDMIKNVGGKAVAVVGAVAVAVPNVIKDTDKLAKNAKKVMDATADVIKLIKK